MHAFVRVHTHAHVRLHTSLRVLRQIIGELHIYIYFLFNSLRLTVVTSGAAVRPVLFAHWVGSVFGKPAWDAVPAFVQTLLHTLKWWK